MEKKRAVGLVLVFCFVPLLNFPRALLGGRSLFARDINTVWSPQIEAVVRQVANGDWPFFDARRSFGQPLFADPRAEVLYPPAWIHFVVPAHLSYALFSAFHLLIAALGAARLGRRLFPGIGFEGELVAGIGYAAGGPLLSLVSHWHHLAAAAWMPWIIESSDAPARRGGRWLGLVLLIALQLLAGSPDYVLLTIVLCSLRLLALPGPSRLRIVGAAGAFILAVLLTAIQLAPSLSMARDAARDVSQSGWNLSRLHPLLSLETVMAVRVESWPLAAEMSARLFDGMQVWMFSHYLGLTTWVLAIVGLGMATPLERRFPVLASAVGLLMAWGVPAPPDLLSSLPLIGGLRFPTKHLAAMSLGVSLLAAKGAGGLSSPAFRSSLRRIAAFVGGCLLALSGLWIWATGGASGVPSAALVHALAPFVLAGIAVAVFRFSAPRAVLPLILGIDLLGTQRDLNPTADSALLGNRPPLTRAIPEGARLYVSDYSIGLRTASIRLPVGTPYKLEQTPSGVGLSEAVAIAATWYLQPPIAGRFGYFGSYDLDVLDFYRAPLKRTIEEFVTSRNPALVLDRLQRGSVGYVVTMDPPSLWNTLSPISEEKRFFEAPVRLYSVPDPWPKARYEGADGTLDIEAGVPQVVEMKDGQILLDASPTRSTRLAVAVSNDRGWRATIDGASATIKDNSLAFPSIDLTAGHHRVEFRYRPPLFDVGLGLSLLASGIIATLAVRAFRHA